MSFPCDIVRESVVLHEKVRQIQTLNNSENINTTTACGAQLVFQKQTVHKVRFFRFR